MKTSESIVKISAALLKAQKSIGSAKKGSDNPFYHHKYADLGNIMEACKDHLNDNGITVLQPVMQTAVETILLHESGEWMSSETPIVCAVANDPQKLGSAISYARRYGLQSMVFIPAEDDDAEGAVEHAKHTPAPYLSQTTGKITNKASDKQIQLIAILLDKKGYSDEQLKSKYQVESKKDLTSVQASEIIDNLNKLPDKQKEII